MLSRVEATAPPALASTDGSGISITKLREVSHGVTVSRLHSGEFAIAAHDGDHRVLIDVSAHELREFATRLLQATER